MRKSTYAWMLAALVPLFAVQAAAQEEGKPQVAVDLHPVIGFDEGFDGFGFGFDVRGGYAMPMDGFKLIPEAVIGWNAFGTGVDEVSASLLRFMGGARASFGDGDILPSVFAHIGYGSLSTTVDFGNLPGFNMGSVSASTGTGLLDIGAALDFLVTEQLFLGGHLAFNHLLAEGGGSYLTFGLQGTYGF